MAKPINITSLKTPKPLVKKALVIASAAAGLIAAGTLLVIAKRPTDLSSGASE